MLHQCAILISNPISNMHTHTRTQHIKGLRRAYSDLTLNLTTTHIYIQELHIWDIFRVPVILTRSSSLCGAAMTACCQCRQEKLSLEGRPPSAGPVLSRGPTPSTPARKGSALPAPVSSSSSPPSSSNNSSLRNASPATR